MINGVKQMPIEGTSFAKSLARAKAPSKNEAAVFRDVRPSRPGAGRLEGRGFHPPGNAFDHDKWELYHLDRDFNEVDDLAEREPERLKAMIDEWWREAEAHKVLPLDDRFAPRFADNAKRFHGPRKRFVFHAGMGHVPTDVAPDVRNRTYTIEADARIDGPATEGVLIAHGDMTCGYALYIKDNRLAYDMNVGGVHHLIVSDRPVPAGNRRLGMRMRRNDGRNIATLLIDGEPAGGFETTVGFVSFISWSGLDIGRDRSSPVSHYEAPFAFTGKLRKVTMTDGRRPGARRRGGGRRRHWRANDRRRRIASGRRQPLRLAAGLRVDVLHRRWAAARSTCRSSALKEIAAEFGDRRAVPSMAYMLGFFAMGVGGVFMGWLADRTSPRVPLLIAGVSIVARRLAGAAAAASWRSMPATPSRSASSAMPPPSRRR